MSRANAQIITYAFTSCRKTSTRRAHRQHCNCDRFTAGDVDDLPGAGIGRARYVPFLEIDDALAAAKGRIVPNIVLGGERRGGKIPGFDVGNSPAEYTPQMVGGKRVFITTTNGTRAMHHARLATRMVTRHHS